MSVMMLLEASITREGVLTVRDLSDETSRAQKLRRRLTPSEGMMERADEVLARAGWVRCGEWRQAALGRIRWAEVTPRG